MTINELNSKFVDAHNQLEIKVHDLDNRVGNAETELEHLSSSINMIHSLTASVDKLAINMDNMLQELKQQVARISLLESKPLKRWESIIDKIITTAIGILVGYLLSNFK